MTEANRKSTCPPGVGREIRLPAGRGAGNPKSEIIRLALIALVAAAILAVGHYGFRAFYESASGGQAGVEAPGAIQFGPSAGRGAADAPAPPRSRPAFSTAARGRPARNLAMYASQAAPEEVIRFYRAEMPRLGWTERKLQRDAPAPDALAMLWYSNAAGDSCIIAVSTQPAAETAVTVLRMPSSGGK
ncbi:MAG: hypothetical protein ACLQVA_09935 [Candidatus Brocadiia bacterium]